MDPTLQGGSSSISGGGFCAYHTASLLGSPKVRYGVMPDTNAGTCAGGCGPAGFDGVTDVSSHELVEVVTDPDNGTGWFDSAVANSDPNNCGEIGISARRGPPRRLPRSPVTPCRSSRRTRSAVASNPKHMLNDFSIAADATVNLPQGGMATATVTLTKVAGVAENVTLTAKAPINVVASFMPASVTTDKGSSTITSPFPATPSRQRGW